MSAKCARLKSLQDSTKKMSKSEGNSRSRILINDTKQEIDEKCAKALSDMQASITYEPEKRPAISNLVGFLVTLECIHWVVIFGPLEIEMLNDVVERQVAL